MRAPGQSRHRTTPGGMNRSLRFAGNLLRVGAGLGTTLAVVALLVSSTRPAPTSVSPQLPVVSRASNGVDRVASSPSDKPLQVAVAVRDPEIDEAVVDRIRRPLQQQIGDLQCQLEHLVVQQRQQGRERQNREQELFQRLAPQETLRKFDRLAKQIASLKEILDERLVVSPVPQPAEAGDVKPVLVVSRSRDQQGRFSIVARPQDGTTRASQDTATSIRFGVDDDLTLAAKIGRESGVDHAFQATAFGRARRRPAQDEARAAHFLR